MIYDEKRIKLKHNILRKSINGVFVAQPICLKSIHSHFRPAKISRPCCEYVQYLCESCVQVSLHQLFIG